MVFVDLEVDGRMVDQTHQQCFAAISPSTLRPTCLDSLWRSTLEPRDVTKRFVDLIVPVKKSCMRRIGEKCT